MPAIPAVARAAEHPDPSRPGAYYSPGGGTITHLRPAARREYRPSGRPPARYGAPRPDSRSAPVNSRIRRTAGRADLTMTGQ